MLCAIFGDFSGRGASKTTSPQERAELRERAVSLGQAPGTCSERPGALQHGMSCPRSGHSPNDLRNVFVFFALFENLDFV